MLSIDQIEKLVKVNFGDNCRVGTITELKGGMFNSAYLIERLSEKDKIVLKVSQKPETKTLTYEKDIMQTEVEVYKLIEEKTTIPTPRILAYDFSKKHIPSNYFFMTSLVGTPMNKVLKKISKDNLVEIKIELAGYLAQLHKVSGNYFGYFIQLEECKYKTWKEAFASMLLMILKDGKDNGIKLPYDRYDKVLSENSKYLEDITVSSLVDYDLWAGNVFVKEQGDNYRIEGIVDFERVFWGDPMAEFAGSFMLLDHIYEEKEVWQVYTQEASRNKELSMEDEIRSTLYQLYLYTIMAVETFRYDFIYGKVQKAYSLGKIKKCLCKLEKYN